MVSIRTKTKLSLENGISSLLPILICCLFNFSPGYTLYDLDIRYWRVYAGEYNISMDDPNEAYYRISRVVLHPGYNSTSLENDIAVVIMSKPIA